MKKRKIMQTTDNSREYRICLKYQMWAGIEWYTKDWSLSMCGCPVHRGRTCNMNKFRKLRSRDNSQKNWKRYRKKQYKGS